MHTAEASGVPSTGATHTLESSPRARAAATISGALGAGVITQALVWDSPVGLGWFVLDVLLVVGAFGVIGGFRRASSGAAVLAAGAIASGAAVVWYASEWALTVGVLAGVSMLAALPFAVEGRWRVSDLGRAAGIFYEGADRAPAAVVDAAKLARQALDARGRSHAWSLVKGLMLGAPITAIFVGLLAADPAFAGAVLRTVRASGEATQFAIASLGAAAAYLVARMLFARRPTSPMDATQEPAPIPYRNVGDLPMPIADNDASTAPRVRPIAWAAVLAQLVVVFAVFAGVNARTLFGGHALVRAPGPLTYARYLHSGFTQLSIATLLAVLTVLVGHALMRPRDPIARSQPVPGGAALAALEATLLALVAVALASCAQRLVIYEEAYGYTYERLGVGFFQIGVLGLVVLTFFKAVARSFRAYAACVALLGGALAVFAAWFNADGYIVRRNIARAHAEGAVPLDWAYLSTLSEDARGAVDAAEAGEHRAALDASWNEQRAAHLGSGWRSLRGLRNTF